MTDSKVNFRLVKKSCVVDDKGRIYLPKVIRETFGVDGSSVSAFIAEIDGKEYFCFDKLDRPLTKYEIAEEVLKEFGFKAPKELTDRIEEVKYRRTDMP